MTRWFSKILLVVVIFGTVPLLATELEEALSMLKEVKERLEYIQKTGLHQQDEGRILILDKANANVVRSINENGLLSVVTFNLYKHLVVKFRYSSQYFEFIRTVKTEAAISELLELMAKIRKKLQLDDDPYSTVLKSNLSQMLEAMDGLRKITEVTAELKGKLQTLRPEMGEAIAIAELGDRPKAFAAAIALYHRIRNLYSLMQGVVSKPGYGLSLEIMGLNEFIGEYAQVEKP